MRKTLYAIRFIAILAGIFILAGCASKPDEAVTVDRGALLVQYRSDVQTSRDQALAAKANVAAPTLFQQAEADLATAKAYDDQDNEEQAVEYYGKAIDGFKAAATEAETLRQKALAALSSADQKQSAAQAQISDLEQGIDADNGGQP